MMKLKTLAVAAAVLFAAGAAQATMVAGWDFSQPAGGSWIIAPGPAVQTLTSNWSDLDTTGNAGLGPNPFGTYYMDGSFGSSAGNPGLITSPGGNLGANAIRGYVGGQMDASSHAALLEDGQFFANPNSVQSTAVASVVFEVDLSSLGLSGTGWELRFGARTTGTGQGSAVNVMFSTTDELGYADLGNLAVDNSDATRFLALGGDADRILVKLTFDGEPLLFDNVTLDTTLAAAPEPAVALMGLAGLAGLLAFSRRR